jgi:hypothetical protein
VLDDGAGRLVEVADELPGGVGVHVIVEGHLLAGDDLRVGDAATLACVIERGALVRVLAVSQIADVH